MMPFLERETVRKWSLALFWLVGATILLKAYSLYVPYGVRYVFTESIPRGLYASVRYDGTALQPGQGVCFRATPREWMIPRHYFSANETICKYALGVPGDRVVPRGAEVFICHADKCSSAGKVLAKDGLGRSSVPAFTTETVIPEGQYYFGSTYNPRSFDSRYLGLVSSQAVTVRTYPLWTY